MCSSIVIQRFIEFSKGPWSLINSSLFSELIARVNVCEFILLVSVPNGHDNFYSVTQFEVVIRV